MVNQLHDKLKTIQDAINYEIDQHYINATGKRTTFSNFIIENTKYLRKELDDSLELIKLISLFNSYPTQDISGRIQTIHKAQDILRDLYKNNKELLESNSNENKKNFAKQYYEKNLRKINAQYIKGVGPRISKLLNKLGVYSVHDLFHFFPRAYIDYQKQVPIKDLRLDEAVTIVAKIKGLGCYDPPKRKNLSIITFAIHDSTGKITISRFVSRKLSKIMTTQYKKQYPINTEVVCAGTVSYDKFTRSYSLSNASIEKVNQNDDSEASLNTSRIVPVYPLTEGITAELMRKATSNALQSHGELIIETLPKEMLQEDKLLDLKTSIHQIHFPESHELCEIARSRLIFEEFFFMQLELAYRRYLTDKNRTGLSLQDKSRGLIQSLLKALPFELTSAQKRVFNEIKSDLMSDKPMHRLLQGDVGSGKTIVALLTLLFAIENGFQTALMAPTEILVNQHVRKFREYLNPLGLEVAELTGSTPAKIKKDVYSSLQNDQIKIVVGTHALLQDEVMFKNLGLVIIDEQHRFGVKQRDELLKKGKNVERLFMTATPIPRTLALSIHGDLSLSEIDELPKGRIPIKTSVVQPWQRNKAFDLIKGEVAKGRQAYIVFPLIEESEKLSAKAAEVEFKELSKSILKDLKVGLLHGELSSKEKDAVMQKFVTKEIDVLVTTTVIEVGMDVSNATVMMIENAERFGLSQLHQLRGRIGRGGDQAYCLLLPQHHFEEASKRLAIMTQTNNGFIISQEDLRIRGPGEFLGTKQSGLPELNLADLIRDVDILEKARTRAINIIKNNPDLSQYPILKIYLNQREESYITAG